jgi:hypothetical protein
MLARNMPKLAPVAMEERISKTTMVTVQAMALTW